MSNITYKLYYIRSLCQRTKIENLDALNKLFNDAEFTWRN